MQVTYWQNLDDSLAVSIKSRRLGKRLKATIGKCMVGLMTSLVCKVSVEGRGGVGGTSYLFGDELKLRL